MLFPATTPALEMPLIVATTEEFQFDPSWYEVCDSGRLWLIRPRIDDTIQAWIAYISYSQKLLCAPRPAPEKSLAEKQLDRMTGLDVDWAADGGEPPNDEARANARQVLAVLNILSLHVEYVTASASSGITICLQRGERYADIECFNTGEIWAVVSARSQSPQTWQLEARRSAVEETLHRIASVLTPQNA